jgi:hypothetical protein
MVLPQQRQTQVAAAADIAVVMRRAKALSSGAQLPRVTLVVVVVRVGRIQLLDS